MPSHRILHLEDDPSDTFLIHRSLKNAGLELEITVATNAADYATALASGDFDLILSDNCIPGFGGLRAFQAAHLSHPETQFISVSSLWDDQTVETLIAAGVSRCVLKSRPTEIVSAVRHALDLRQARKEARRLLLGQSATDLLVTAVQALSHARDFDTIREIVRHAARALTGADGATLVLRDGDYCHYIDEDAISPLWKGSRFPLSTCISGWVMCNRQSVAIEDVYADPRIPADAYRPTFVKSLLMVPVRSDDPIAAIGNYWATAHTATPREIELLQALANTTAVAMENVRIHAELEQRVRERTLQLEAANRELETFSFSVSHDLRSPLQGISAFTELLENTAMPPTEDQRREYLAHIRRQTERMDQLIGDFLRLAQITRADLKPEPVDLVGIAAGIIASLRTSTPDRRVEFVHPESLPVSGDPQLVQVVMQNLLSNAWKYTGRRKTDAQIELGVLAAGPSDASATFFVRDNGAGFDQQHAGKLFTPFQRLHSSREFPGSGVGLATVQRIIVKHGGLIRAEGRPDEGATFYFTLAPERS